MSQEHYARTHPFSRVPIMHPALLYDNASGTFNWTPSATGVDYTSDYHPDAAFVDTNGLRLITKTTDPANLDFVAVSRHLWIPPGTLVRLQAVFHFPTYSINCRLKFILSAYDGTIHQVAGIAANPQLGEVFYVYDLAGDVMAWGVLPGVTIPTLDAAWHKLDFSFNLSAGVHHLLHLNSFAVDTCCYPIPSFALGAQRRATLRIELETYQAAQATAYIDQILLTAENP